ncbi:MAG: hypothetical protein WCG75_08255 [Armatimonadota bacterium]
MFSRTLSSILIGITGIFLLGVGLTALGLTASPRPSTLSPSLYAHLRQLEWAVVVIFVPLGMLFVRMTVLRLSKPKTKE